MFTTSTQCSLDFSSLKWEDDNTNAAAAAVVGEDRDRAEKRKGYFYSFRKKKKEDLDEIVQFIFICKILVE